MVSSETGRLHISLAVIPNFTLLGSVSGIYEVLTGFEEMAKLDNDVPSQAPFDVDIVGEKNETIQTPAGLPVTPHHSTDEIQKTDIIIFPALLLPDGKWTKGKHDKMVEWARRMHSKGALVCSACSGGYLLAETGLVNGKKATVHWASEVDFRQNFPEVNLDLSKALVTSGDRDELIMSGALGSWHDLVLTIIARTLSPAAALSVCRLMLFEWHSDGQGPYACFIPNTAHDDALVSFAQTWIKDNYACSSPVEEMVRNSGIPERSFKRRFSNATGYSPLTYVQRVRVEIARRKLECTDLSIDEISWSVGYDDPAFFRRLFKRATTMTPGAYRKKFSVL